MGTSVLRVLFSPPFLLFTLVSAIVRYTIALKATIFNADLSISGMIRNIFLGSTVTIARRPIAE